MNDSSHMSFEEFENGVNKNKTTGVSNSTNKDAKTFVEEELAKLSPEEIDDYRENSQFIMFDKQLRDAMELLDDDQLGLLLRLSYNYLKTGKIPEIEDKLLKSQFYSWQNAINMTFTRYIKRSIYGKRGGGQIGNQNARKKYIKPSDGTKTS